jgi:CTP:molybdopterin cytidylyltransferase MocA
MTVAAIVLAAGASTRMGASKPLIEWGETTLLRWELDQLARSSVDRIVVVTGRHADDVRRSLGDGARYCVFNSRWPHGRAGSLARGAQGLLALLERDGTPEAPEALEAVVVLNVDQPTRHDIIDALVDELRDCGADVVQPAFEGKGGHPVVVAGRLLAELADVQEETLGLRAVLERHPPHPLVMDNEPVVRLDLDTPDTLEEARRLLGIEGAGGVRGGSSSTA